MGCAERCGGLPAEVGLSCCEEFLAENDESIVTAFGVFEQETIAMNFRV